MRGRERKRETDSALNGLMKFLLSDLTKLLCSQPPPQLQVSVILFLRMLPNTLSFSESLGKKEDSSTADSNSKGS
jgi:hypothetical protein